MSMENVDDMLQRDFADVDINSGGGDDSNNEDEEENEEEVPNPSPVTNNNGLNQSTTIHVSSA